MDRRLIVQAFFGTIVRSGFQEGTKEDIMQTKDTINAELQAYQSMTRTQQRAYIKRIIEAARVHQINANKDMAEGYPLNARLHLVNKDACIASLRVLLSEVGFNDVMQELKG